MDQDCQLCLQLIISFLWWCCAINQKERDVFVRLLDKFL